jgi:Lon protease-like protein
MSEAPAFPDRLGVFPLPQVVLFPDAHLPLHVFEPRYRALVRDALAGDGRLVMAVLQPGYEADYYGGPPVHPWACAGRIVRHQPLDDDSSDIVLRGERVVRILEFVQDVPYRVARLEPQPVERDFAEKPGQPERLAELRDLLDQACPGATSALETRLVARPETDGGMELLHTLASCFPVKMERKIEWLACDGSLDRWTRLRDMLRGVAAERDRKSRCIVRYADLKPDDPKHN